jgi:hypothetical protein
MNRFYLAGCLAMVLAIGFVAGRITSPTSSGPDPGYDPDSSAKLSSRTGNRPAPDAANTAFAKLRQEIRTAHADKIPGLVYRALESADPFVQRPLLDELYARMDASNFLAMTEELNRISRETGRAHYDEWLLIHTRAGQVAGQATMDRWSKANALGGQLAERSLWGWASSDPDAARQWLDANETLAPELRGKFLSTILSGAIVHDADRAIAMLSQLPEADRNRCANEFSNQLIQNSGKDRALEWLRSLRTAEPDSSFTASVTRQVFDRAIWSGANQTHAGTMVRDLEQLATIMPIDETWIGRAMGQIRDRNVTGGIDLLDQIAGSTVLKDIPLSDGLWQQAVGHALQRNRAAVATWLESHPDSPIHQSVSGMFSGEEPVEQ